MHFFFCSGNNLIARCFWAALARPAVCKMFSRLFQEWLDTLLVMENAIIILVSSRCGPLHLLVVEMRAHCDFHMLSCANMPNLVHRAYMFQVDLSRLSLHSRYTFNAPNICSESGADSEERLGTREQGRAKNSSWCADALFVISRFKLTYAFRLLFQELPDRPRH